MKSKKTKTYLKFKPVYLITPFHLPTKIHLLESIALAVKEKICMEDHKGQTKPHNFVNIAYVHLLYLCRPHNDEALLMSLAMCRWGILHSCKAAPKAWSVLGRGILYTPDENVPNILDWRQVGIEQANLDDPHCSTAGTSVLQ